MLKYILVLLGETPSSIAARHYAFRLAQSMNAEVTGLAGVDLSYIEEPILRFGLADYISQREENLKKQADELRKRLRLAYERECELHCVTCEWISVDGNPTDALSQAIETRDLLITGHDPACRSDVHEQLSELLAKLLLITPRPVILCADKTTVAQEILIAYDGSIPAMRAVQLFALLGLGRDHHVRIASIDADCEQAARRASGAVSYLRSHGYEAEANPIASSVDPADVLRIEVANRQIGTLVIGAYGRRGFRERLFGSTTSALVGNPPCPIFIYH